GGAGRGFELGGVWVVEVEAGPGDYILDRLRHEHFAGVRERGDARPDVDGDPSHLFADELTLAGVDAGAHVEAERTRAVADGERAVDCTRGAVEGREEPVTGGVDVAAAPALAPGS